MHILDWQTQTLSQKKFRTNGVKKTWIIFISKNLSKFLGNQKNNKIQKKKPLVNFQRKLIVTAYY